LVATFHYFAKFFLEKLGKTCVNVFVDKKIPPLSQPPKGDQLDILNGITLNFTIWTSMDKMFIKLYKCNHFSYSHEYEYDKNDNATMSIDMAK
jgi:hypothetical protein